MAHQGSPQAAAGSALSGQPPSFGGLLCDGPVEPDPADEAVDEVADQEFLADLRLDLVIDAVAGQRDERDLIAGLLRRRVRDTATLEYRHEVFADFEDPQLFDVAMAFCRQMHQVRAHLRQLGEMRSSHQRGGWFLDAAVIYCDAVRALAAGLEQAPIASRALRAFREYLTGYLAGPAFAELAQDTAERKGDLARVVYLVRVKAPRVEVSRYDGELDYSAEIEETFERFRQCWPAGGRPPAPPAPSALQRRPAGGRPPTPPAPPALQGTVKDYRVSYRHWPPMNHVGERILDLVARLFSDEFDALSDYCDRHAGFADLAIARFDREVQFYLAYLEYTKPLRSAGLEFCTPAVRADAKEIFARATFDLALAAKLVAGGGTVVTNDFELHDPERVIVVTGPNQGGKTTFARTFGQLHHLAAVGCPVPGSAARLFLPDQIFTHFEREEDIAKLTGKLEDDLLRIQRVLLAATSDSIVVMNEIFTSTTVNDALYLGQKVLTRVVELDLLCVYVTFIDELTSFGATVVSMASTIVPGDPARRTYKVVRKPADGLAYALAIARKHQVSYELLRRRVAR